MPVKGTKIVAGNIIKYGGQFLNTVNGVMKGVELLLDTQVTKNISLTDHSLKDLKDLNHPYASKHGNQGIRIHDPYWKVHKQSGELLSSKESGIEKATIAARQLTATAFVKLDPAKASHALHVIFGTSKMIPRPVLSGSRDQIIDKAFNLIKSTLKDLTFRFRGTETLS